ncbi:cation:proton antiporter [Persicobacter sp. CCB-QB2]|uniref:cation:proton antiporter n=1 Tax=Persicobacter sp. CCB-QB2 TaxID=1561025 RepID=UPI0006A9C4BD|nr:cation:proton antiporter [Persicobacter sp. CCB-QB2]
MEKLNHSEVINLLLQLAIILGVARLLAEVMRRLKQPAVVGEIMAGVLLGPTLFGRLAPELWGTLFPTSGSSAIVLDGFFQIAVVLLLFIAGLEVELDLVIEQGKKAANISLSALIIPFILGFIGPFMAPEFYGLTDDRNHLVFALFIGTTLSITALPVIARILMDLNIFKTRTGMLIIASAMIIDILGWLIFTVILSMMGSENGHMGLGETIGLTMGFTLAMLTIGRALINKILPWINARLAWPGGLLSLSMALCFLAAAFTEWIGIHAIFGSFIVGIALGDSVHLSERAKEIVHHFINNIFAPLFFVSIGLHVNFIESFNFPLVVVLIITAFVGKVIGGYGGAKISGLSKHDSLAIGFGMNTHGTLEVILGAIALQAGLIENQLFVAIVIMVLVTIIISAPLLKMCIQLGAQAKKDSE